MRSSLAVEDIRFAPARLELCSKGLIGWVCLRYGDLHLDGLAVRRRLGGGYRLSFPTRTDEHGTRHAYYRPLDQSARAAIEAQVLGELRRRGLIPEASHSPTTATWRRSAP